MQIKFMRQPVKFIRKQDAPTRKRLINAINALPYGDIKKLKGRNGYRLRVGDFRVIFDSDGNIILVIRIDSRGQIYKE